MPVTKSCEHCGASYVRPPSIAAKSRFCGRACADAAQTGERKEIKCKRCGGAFVGMKDHGVWQKYCGRECFLEGRIEPASKECQSCGGIFLASKTNTGMSEDGRRIYCSKKCASQGLRKTTERTCVNCGVAFYPSNMAQNSDQQTCGFACRAAYFRGARSAGYRGGVYFDSTTCEKRVLAEREGYVGKYIQSHRVAASVVIGRLVRRGEVVVRINRDPQDDRPENLFLCASMSEFCKRRQGSLPWPTESNLRAIHAAEQQVQGGAL